MNILVTIFYQPLFNLLVWLYNVIPGHDMGVTIIALTVIIRLILYPLAQRAIVSQRAMQTLQPKIDQLREELKNDKEKLSKELMELYKREKINPVSSCLPVLIQLPFLFALFAVFNSGLNNGGFELLYPFVKNPGSLNTMAFGFFDLVQKNIPLAVITGILQFVQTKMLMVSNKNKTMGTSTMTKAMNQQMLYMMPIFTIIIGASLAAGITLYWLITTLFSIGQQYFLLRHKPPTSTPEIIG
ncbi:MAG: YidC/Oxa1 family membrane protein insertase [Candidatus Komeilibacteria bacterium]